MNFLIAHLNQIAAIILMVGGLFIVFSTGNLIRRMIGLAIFQGATGLFYISLGKVTGGTAPVLIDKAGDAGRALGDKLDPTYIQRFGVDSVVYSNPLPSVLILTAIVVGVSTLAVGLAIAVRIREAYGTIEAHEIEAADVAVEAVGEK
jgi:multicomponent Na+:H+ antiporter subunit C